MNEFNFNNFYSFLIGQRLRKARKMLTSMLIRVIKKDGHNIPIDASYKDNRINVETHNGIIVNILGIG